MVKWVEGRRIDELIVSRISGLHAGRTEKSVADNVRGRIVNKEFLQFRVKFAWFTVLKNYNWRLNITVLSSIDYYLTSLNITFHK